MSIFITLIAFKIPEMVNIAKIAILISSLIAGITGYLLLKLTLTKRVTHGGEQWNRSAV